MKMKKLITVTALALAVVSLVSTHASAQSAGTLDLILGFQASGGTGANTNLEIDLGPASNFATTTSSTSFSQLLGSDLTATYGSNWATRTDLSWGISGITDNLGNNTFDTTINTSNPRVSSDLSGPAGVMSSLVGGFNSGTLAGNANAVTVGNGTTPASTIGNSYTSLVGAGGGTNDYGFFQHGQTQDVNATGPLGSLELYHYFQSGKVSGKFPLATDLGTFTLGGSGSTATLTFQGVAAVPEPSTWMLALCGLLLILVIRRRNFQV